MRWWYAIFLLLWIVPASAQPQHTEWDCRFSRAVTYDGGTEKNLDVAKYSLGPDKFELKFIDDNKEAYLVSVPPTQVARSPNAFGGIQYIEITNPGAVQVTALDKHGNAVHSRHTVMPDGTITASQYYGRCTRK